MIKMYVEGKVSLQHPWDHKKKLSVQEADLKQRINGPYLTKSTNELEQRKHGINQTIQGSTCHDGICLKD